MKVIIAGSRTITDYKIVEDAVNESEFNISEVVCGKAKGVDLLGETYGKENNIPIKYFPPDWKTYGKKAGFIRNKMMGDYAHGLIAVWDGESPGTRHMIEYAKKKGLSVFVKIVNQIPDIGEYIERKGL